MDKFKSSSGGICFVSLSGRVMIRHSDKYGEPRLFMGCSLYATRVYENNNIFRGAIDVLQSLL